MHEMSIAMSVVRIAEDTARENGASRVVSVTVDIGELSGVMPDAVEFCYEACARGTAAEGSRLVINKIKARAFCPSCEKEFMPDTQFTICPRCSGFAAVTEGDDLKVRELEVE